MIRNKVSEFSEQIRGVSYKPTDLHDSLNEKSIILLRANNISEGYINFDDVVYVDKSKVSEKQLLKTGDILVCASSGSKHLVGKAAQVDFEGEYTFGAFCKVVRPKNIDTDYLGMYFQSGEYRRTISAISQGANINNIKNENIDDLPIKVPDEYKQASISRILKSVSEIIRLRKVQLNFLDELIKSQFIEMFGDPVLNPKNWEMVELSQIAEIKIGPFGTLLHKEDYISGGHALVNPSHIIDGKICCDNDLSISEEKYRELESYSLKKYDLVLGRRGEMGRCAVVNEDGLLCGTGSMIIRSNGEISPEILQKIFSFPSYKKTIEDKAVGQTMANLNVPIVSKFLIPRIPSEIQNEYFEFVQATGKLKFAVLKSLEETQLLFDSLMQQYFG